MSLGSFEEKQRYYILMFPSGEKVRLEGTEALPATGLRDVHLFASAHVAAKWASYHAADKNLSVYSLEVSKRAIDPTYWLRFKGHQPVEVTAREFSAQLAKHGFELTSDKFDAVVSGWIEYRE